MTELRDLFGAPLMRRGAIFDGQTIRRTLSRDWQPGPRALVIGCNPSVGNADRDDPTILWLIAWFTLFGFGGFDLVNLYPFVTSSPKECRARVTQALDGGEWHDRDALFANRDMVALLAKDADQVFVCWGAIAWDPDWIDSIVEEIQTGVAPYPHLWCWGGNADGSPKHPMARGNHRIPRDQQPILWRKA